MDSFEDWLNKKICEESTSIYLNTNSPERHTEFGNDMCLRRVEKHRERIAVYNEVLDEYKDRECDGSL